MTDELILVAEDDADLRDLVMHALEAAGYRTVGAKDGNTAARIASVARPAAIITDVWMPALSGRELCHMVRRNPELRDTAVIMMSSDARDGDVAAGYRSGADAYLPKPLVPRNLVGQVDSLLRHRRHKG